MENSPEFARPPRGVAQEQPGRPYAERHSNGILSEGDYLALLRTIEVINACESAAEFPACVTREASKLMPNNLTGYNEVRLREGRMIAVLEPPVPGFEEDYLPHFERLMHEHPLIRYSNQTGDGQALKISDFLSRKEYHGSGLYRMVYRHIRAEDQIAFSVVPEKGVVIGIALNRPAADFTERDRRVLNLLRPHIVRAYANLRRFALQQEERDNLHHAFQTIGRGLVAVDRAGSLVHATPGALETLGRYFAVPLANAPQLPRELAAWLDTGRDTPLSAQQDGSRLIVRFVEGTSHRLLLLSEEPATKNPRPSYQLTPRETEVLRWLAEGKTNGEIAAILEIAPGTIKIHVERILEKLGVENRTAAALIARESQIITGA